MRTRSLALTASGLAGVGVAAFTAARRRWQTSTHDLTGRLVARTRSSPTTVSLGRELHGVPAVVANFFRATLRDGQPMITGAHLTWRGDFNMGKPGHDNWRPFTAEQDFNPAAPGFIWNARVRLAPGLFVLVRDGFVDGRATMRAAALGAIPVVNATPTADLASGALQRYLGEAAWLPTALLPSQGVQWAGIDDRRARATLTVGATTVSLEFTFDDRARPVRVFAPHRVMDDGKGHAEPHPWEATMLSFAEHDGMTVPNRSAAAWLLPGGRFEYWRGTPVEIRYEYHAGV